MVLVHPAQWAVAVMCLVVYGIVWRYGDDEARTMILPGKVLNALAIAITLAVVLFLATPAEAGVIPDPECPYYVIFGIPIPSGECFCLLFGTCG